ncbi:MAG: glycosyltransferase family 4 protein [Hydrogenophaga sp.]|nr:glycosyltransferase family 4 protein [Hydrogenophaga sp.]
MRVLLTHNFYGSSAPSGENQVYEAERTLLKNRGHEVNEFTRNSDEIRARGTWGAVQGAMATPWNPWMARAMRQTVENIQPTVVHMHNTFPLISPAIFSAIGKRAARVLTLHNYRLFCPAAIPMREGRVCTECLDRQSVAPALQYGCYRGSRLATVPLAANVALHRWLGTWDNHVDAYIALSEFQRERMVRAGLPVEKVHVKPNFYPGKPVMVPWHERTKQTVFVGRLSEEKGLRTLLKAWALWGETAPQLRLVGDGPLRAELQAQAAGLNVEFLGQLPAAQAQAEIARAQLLVLPSECFESFGMVVCEAFAFGTPAAVSNLGPLPSIVQTRANGLVFEAASATSLLAKVRAAWMQSGLLERLGLGARRAFETHYNEDANYQTLMKIYVQAMAENRRGRA